MAHINLLPWRQELRQQRQQEFIATLGAVAIIAASIILFLHIFLSVLVNDQKERNFYLKNEIGRLNSQIKKINILQKRHDELQGRISIIQDLQRHRTIIVHVFDELARVMPEGIYLKSLERTGNTFKMTGIAENATQVSNLMRHLEASPWFKNPVLSTVATDSSINSTTKEPFGQEPLRKNNSKPHNNKFALTVQLESPKARQQQSP